MHNDRKYRLRKRKANMASSIPAHQQLMGPALMAGAHAENGVSSPPSFHCCCITYVRAMTTAIATCQYGHSGGLASTIVTKHSRYLAFVHVQTDIFHRNFLARSRTKLLHTRQRATRTTVPGHIVVIKRRRQSTTITIQCTADKNDIWPLKNVHHLSTILSRNWWKKKSKAFWGRAHHFFFAVWAMSSFADWSKCCHETNNECVGRRPCDITMTHGHVTMHHYKWA